MLTEVLYHASEPWKVGEKKADREARFREKLVAPLAVEERYPDSYAGRVISVRAVADVVCKRLPSLRDMADKDHPVVVLDLMPEQVEALASRRSKIAGGAVADVTFDDRWGAVAPILRAQFEKPEEAEAKSEDPFDVEGRRFAELSATAADLLPKTETHTGTGLYSVKASPTKNDDTQSGAPSGQVITVTTGGLGTSDAFKGGYVTNMTESETRAIVSHTDTTITLEGDLTNWTDGDDLDIYDAWSTIQGALDQLYTDQGTDTFTATQYVRVFAGTYDENVAPNTALVPDRINSYLLVIEGDPADDRENIVVAPSSGAYCFYFQEVGVILRHMKLAGDASSAGIQMHSAVMVISDIEIDFGSNANATGITQVSNYPMVRYEDLKITISGAAKHAINWSAGTGAVRRCTLIGPGKATSTGYGVIGQGGPAAMDASVVSGFKIGVANSGTAQKHEIARVTNCTFYDCASAIHNTSNYDEYLLDITVSNCIFKDCTTVLRIDQAWPEEDSAGQFGGNFVLRNNCYHGYTAFATRDSDSSTKTYTQFAAFNQVDASGDLDATDPLLTNPGSGDFSLEAASKCRHRGMGSGVIKDINGDLLDPFHPDIGAVSTGIGPNVAYGI